VSEIGLYVTADARDQNGKCRLQYAVLGDILPQDGNGYLISALEAVYYIDGGTS
jgi:hypothetical protein